MKQLFNPLLIGILCLFITSSFAQNTDAFITIWRTTEADESITIETNQDYTYDYTIDWGDGTKETHVTRNITHTYQDSGDHEISITGTFPAFQEGIVKEDYELIENRKKLIEIKQWGNQEWETMEYAFSFCSNLTGMDPSAPNLSKVTSMGRMFLGASSFNQPINHWNTANITNMRALFKNATSFNQPLDNWDTSMVTDMVAMFHSASSFNQPLNGWDTSNVQSMSSIFANATSFNQPLDNWNTSNVTTMSYMFENASSFNQSLNNWDTSKVREMSWMFRKATSFNQSLGNWDISNIEYMEIMLNNSGLSVENYDSTLIGWEQAISKNNSPKYIILGAKGLTYCAEEARQSLIDNHEWTIEGDSKNKDCDGIVDYISFYGVVQNNKPVLKWKTAKEVNNKGFEVQHSSDNENWEVLDFVNGQGTTNDQIDYSFIHDNPQNGINYYRLNQISENGKESYTSVILIETEGTTTSTNEINNDNISIYPNPARDFIALENKKPYAIYNRMGQIVLEGYEKTIDVSSLQTGLYIINIDGQVQKFTKL